MRAEFPLAARTLTSPNAGAGMMYFSKHTDQAFADAACIGNAEKWLHV